MSRRYNMKKNTVQKEFRNMKLIRAVGITKWILVVVAVICCILIRLFYWYNRPGTFLAFGRVTQVIIANIAVFTLVPVVCLSALLFLAEKIAKGGKGMAIVAVTTLIVLLCGGAVAAVAFNNKNAFEMMYLNEFDTPDGRNTLYYVESKGERERVIYRRTGKFTYEKTVSYDIAGKSEDYMPSYHWGKESFSDGENEYPYSSYNE